MIAAILSISVGASLGAICRWLVSLWLNPWLSLFPLGTLLVNCVGGFLIGLAFTWFALHDGASENMKLLIMTGFLGGLTTFSAFSIEVVNMLQIAHYGRALFTIALHLTGSIICTILGIAVMRAAQS